MHQALLAFFAHPDDEAFACGGTLAAAASRGHTVHVVSATRGEQGGDPGRRSRELARSCRILGSRPPVFLDLPDGALAANREELRARFVRFLQAHAIDAVITMGPDGAYGHADHVVCSEVASAVGHPTVLHAVFPAQIFEPVRRRLARTCVPLAPAVPQARPDRILDIRSYAERKLAALAAHASQLPGGEPRNFLTPGLIDELLGEEAYRHAAGPELSDPLARLFEPCGSST